MKNALPFVMVFLLASQLVNAQEYKGYFRAKNTIGVGAAYQKADAELRASVGDLPEVQVDLGDLGMDDKDWSWALEWRWRFKPKWMLVGLAYTFDQGGNRTAERDFNFDGKEFKAGVSIDTEMEINTYILDVMYEVYSTERAEIFIGGGIHAIDLEASLSGRAFVGDMERQRATGSSEILAPLPNFRAQAFYSLGSNTGLALAMGWLSANYEDYDGSFFYVHPRFGWAFSDSWAITAGHQWVDIDLEYKKSSTRESEFNVEFKGPTVVLNYRF